MNIAVCVKYVPDATGDRHFEDDKTVDRVGVDGLLSELDEYAVEQALQIKEKAENPEDVDRHRGLRRPRAGGGRRAQGAADGCRPGRARLRRGDRRLRLDRHLAGAREGDRDRGSYDLVMCGMASTDGAMSVVPAMLAERLGLPQLTLASVVEAQGDQVRIKRDGDTATEVVGGTMPLVLSVTDQSGEARYPSFKGIMAAKKKPLETLSLSDLGVDAGDVGLSVAWTAGRGHHGPARRARPARSSRTRTARAPRRWPTSSPPRSSSDRQQGATDA